VARLAGASIRGQNATYSLELEWNEDRFVEGTIAFEIIAKRIPDNGDKRGPQTVKAVVWLDRKDDRSPDVVINVGDEVVFRDSLANLTGDNIVLDTIPGATFGLGDPVLGCFIRAGISATLSQILSCRDHTAGHGWGMGRLAAIGRCLLENGVRMGARTLWRAGRCIASG
jgi:hypothetical protein